MSTFRGLNTGLTALNAHHKAISITGQNISNVNTEGYSRQRVDLQSIESSKVPAFYSTSDGIGQGVNSDLTIRIRDNFLERRAHTEAGTLANLVEQSTQLRSIETAFREPGEYGLQSVMADMYAGWGDVSSQPHDNAARAQLLQQSQTVVSTLNATHAALSQQFRDTRDNLGALVAEVNSDAAAIADLNRSIRVATQSGMPSHELADKRDVLVLGLAQKVGATITTSEDGMTNVSIGGTPLVFADTANELRITGTTDVAQALTDPVRIESVASNYPVAIGGTAEGRVAALNSHIPNHIAALDSVAQKMALDINSIHITGYTSNGMPGEAFFERVDSTKPMGAGNIRLGFTDPTLVASSALPPVAGQPTVDGSNADALAQLGGIGGGAVESYRSVIVNLGVLTQGITRSEGIQQVIVTNLNASRESIAGVNIDEEMVNMVAFQQAYQAAARVISSVDEMLDTLINRTGIVGR